MTSQVSAKLKFSEESIGINFQDTGLDNGFSDLTPKTQEAKGKNRQTELHQSEYFVHLRILS